jgi:molybdopterin/thiamine biosynthesis adenylyltransferase
MENTAVEIKIHKFVLNYGVEQLITWIEYFDTVITSGDYSTYRKLERLACEACGVTLADMRNLSNTNCTNARRIISFLALHTLKLKISTIANLLCVSDRTVNYYINDSEDWINAPNANKTFYESYRCVSEKFKIEQ